MNLREAGGKDELQIDVFRKSFNTDSAMVIDYDKIEPVVTEGFKGGKGPMTSRPFFDGNTKINLSSLAPGASAGYHKHAGTLEVMYVVSGELTFDIDGQKEVCRAGQAHYCPEGHGHAFVNSGDGEAVFLCVVPTVPVRG